MKNNVQLPGLIFFVLIFFTNLFATITPTDCTPCTIMTWDSSVDTPTLPDTLDNFCLEIELTSFDESTLQEIESLAGFFSSNMITITLSDNQLLLSIVLHDTTLDETGRKSKFEDCIIKINEQIQLD